VTSTCWTGCASAGKTTQTTPADPGGRGGRGGIAQTKPWGPVDLPDAVVPFGPWSQSRSFCFCRSPVQVTVRGRPSSAPSLPHSAYGRDRQSLGGCGPSKATWTPAFLHVEALPPQRLARLGGPLSVYTVKYLQPQRAPPHTDSCGEARGGQRTSLRKRSTLRIAERAGAAAGAMDGGQRSRGCAALLTSDDDDGELPAPRCSD